MTSSAPFATTEEAARLLNVTVQHVRRLTDSGDLTRLARGLVDRSSIDRYLAQHPISRTRAWAEHTAWGAIALLSGGQAPWLGASQASRLRGTLRDMSQPRELMVRTRDRASVHVYAGHTATIPRLKKILSSPDLTRLGLAEEVGEATSVDGYLAAEDLGRTIRSLGLIEGPNGRIVIRSTGFDIDVVQDLAVTGTVLAALDAATSVDPRIRGVGERALTAILNSYR